jgi:Ser-tRNA(Ala) deacylase AlaX
VPTGLLYLEDAQLFKAGAEVVSVARAEDGQHVIILDATIFYPQGGGQPPDRGEIYGPAGAIAVHRVSVVDGDVHHIGTVTRGDLRPGDRVELVINADLRRRHALLHTGGHVVMTAVDRLVGYHPVKGYHFPDGPYVEFEGPLPAERRSSFAAEMQETVNALITGDTEVTAHYASVEELRSQGVHVPAEIPAGKTARVVVTAGYQSPCGGTHVQRLGELTALRIRGLKVRSGRTRVGYQVS